MNYLLMMERVFDGKTNAGHKFWLAQNRGKLLDQILGLEKKQDKHLSARNILIAHTKINMEVHHDDFVDPLVVVAVRVWRRLHI